MEVTDSEKPSLKFPDELIYDIILRLPGKSLLRFRSLSKNWRNVIDSLPFANRHISTRERVAAAEEPQILPLSWPFDCSNPVHSFIYDGNAIKKIETPILEFTRNSDCYCHILAFVACGLLCFQNPSRKEPFLYNPLMREVLELPRPLSTTFAAGTTSWYGIGFDSTTNSYKIVRLCLPYSESTAVDAISGMRSDTQVYTLGTKSWRGISSSVCFKPADSCGVSASGDMHWKYFHYSHQKAHIMSFDFSKEEFKETPVPNFDCQDKHCRQFELIDLKGFLAVVSFPSHQHIDIWMLKDYANKEWVREYRFRTQDWARELDNNVVIVPDICFWKGTPIAVCNGGLAFEALNIGQIFLLDLKTNRVWCMQTPESYRYDMGSTYSYTGSVLSLRKFGNLIEEIPDEYKFLNTARRVYVSA